MKGKLCGDFHWQSTYAISLPGSGGGSSGVGAHTLCGLEQRKETVGHVQQDALDLAAMRLPCKAT